MREAPEGASRAGLPPVQQRARPAHLRQRRARGVEDVARAFQDGHERMPARGRERAGEPDPLRPGREVLLRRGRGASARLSSPTREGLVRGPGEILVVSCYELGHQPVAAATALAELRRSGFQPAALDVSVEQLDEEALRRARLVAVSVPMHTALRLGVRVAEKAPQTAHVCFFGIYAELNAAHLLSRHADSVIGAESDGPLRALAQALEAGRSPESVPGVRTTSGATAVPAEKLRPDVPSRAGLPVLDRYAKLEIGGELRVVASVEARRRRKHLSPHSPPRP